MAELAVPAVLEPEQAGQRYADALRTAVAACAADTAGQTCFICMDGDDEEGLSCVGARAAGRPELRTCRAWRGRRRSRSSAAPMG